ncbi:MAG: hypothetical protein ABIX28_16665 [Vicinamibacterales bacterium]
MQDFLKELAGLDAPPELLEQLKRFQRAPLPHLETISRHLGLVRTFTPKLYEKVVEALPPPVPSLADFVAAADAKPLLGYEQRWSIGERTRVEYLDHWDTARSDRADWVRRLVELLDPADPVEGLDRLQLLFLGDQATARTELRSAFDAASTANDIPRCAALVQSMSSVWKFADTESSALLEELKAASQARNLFITEFDQTREYFPRPLDGVLTQFARATDERWIFHLWATGGMGKTTMLRRLISHEWIVGTDRLPCAWLDLDYLDVGTILQQPALLALAMAAQWNEQLSRPVFGAFLSPSFKPLSALLFRTRGDGSAVGLPSEALDQSSRGQYRAGLSNPMRCGMLAGAVPPRTPEDRARLLSQTTALLSYWNDKLPDALATMSDGRPILLVLDTVEDASVHFAGQLLNLLTLLRTLRQQAQARAKVLGQPPVNLRLVLSGRNHLGEGDHVPQFAASFAGECLERPLEGLEDPEAEAFLEQELTAERLARMPDDLLAAMVEKSQGIPFNLALFAEWASEDDGLDANTVRRSEAVSAVMLIERIIKRIPYQPLRWIIRYGVVPRQLTREFLHAVMREPLLEALSGRAAASGVDKPESRLEQDVWKLEPGFVFDAETLWNERVLRYASARNWIRPGDHPDTVSFRSDILQPMRLLLKQQIVFEPLHERARTWFEQSAAGDRFVDSTTESLYHRVQLRSVPGRAPDDLLPTLRNLLDTPALARSHGSRATTCGALLGDDFSGLAPAERAYVQYRLAEALAAQNDYSFATPAARNSLALAAEVWAMRAPEQELSWPLPAFARLWLAAFQKTSLSELLGALHAVPADDQLRLSLLIAEVAPPRSPVTADVLRGAVATAQAMTPPSVPVGVLAERLARNLLGTDPDECIRYFTIAAADYGAAGETLKRSDMLRRASGIELELGRLTRAEAAVSSIADDVETPAVHLQLARIELSKGNPGLALARLERARSVRDIEQIEVLLLKAEALSQRMLIREAVAVWEDASKLASDQANTRALSRVAVGQARLYRWWLRATDEGMPGTVLSMLQLSQSRRSEAAQRTLEAPVADVEVWQILCDRSNPDRWRRRAFGELGGESPVARIRLTLALSQVASPLPSPRWNDLVEDAGRVPRSARFVALTEPVLLGSPASIEPRVREAIADAFAYEPEGVIEHAWYAIRYGELLAWLGFYERAVDLLEAGVPVLDAGSFGKGWAAAVYRERRRVERRIRQWLTAAGRSPFPAPTPDPPDLWDRFWGHTPLRASAANLENACTAVEAGQFALARACLDRAAPALAEVRFDTEFHATARELRRRTGLDEAPEAAASVGPPAPGPAGAAGSRLGGPGFTVFGMRAESGHVAVALERPRREGLISADSETLEVLLRARTIARRLVARPLDEIAVDLAELLREAHLDVHGPRTFLKIPLSALCGAPWELAFVDAPLPVRLPSIWREAEVERQSQMDGPQEYENIAAAAQVLLQPLSGQDKESPAFKAYLNLGSRLERRLNDTSRAPARFVYVASSFIELPDVDEPALGGVSWTATTLSYTIETAIDAVLPAVILDVPLPATSTDLTHQLLLRNLFAQLLLDSGRVSCVLATGLRPEPETIELQMRLLQTLTDPNATQIDLWTVVETFTREAKLKPHDAFFTANPYRPLAVTRFGVA